MEIAGVIKNSLVDYPSNIACVVFTPGCNMNCWYCHNRDIINEFKGSIEEDEVFEFLNLRRSFLDGVVITGGEPTMQPDLENFIKKVKDLGYKVKLDTNGTNTQAIKNLVEKKLIDYIAMDIKAPLNRYNIITSVPDLKEIENSINYIMQCGVDYEFRTTFAPNLTENDIEQIVELISGAKTYALQQYKKPNYLNENALKAHLPEVLLNLKQKLENKVQKFIVRNI